MCFFFFKQKTAYDLRISDWSSDVCSSDLDQYAVRSKWLIEPTDRDTLRPIGDYSEIRGNYLNSFAPFTAVNDGPGISTEAQRPDLPPDVPDSPSDPFRLHNGGKAGRDSVGPSWQCTWGCA